VSVDLTREQLQALGEIVMEELARDPMGIKV
jgi:hypothetical protein